jgi:hypothetical protein
MALFTNWGGTTSSQQLYVSIVHTIWNSYIDGYARLEVSLAVEKMSRVEKFEEGDQQI